jgi:predicted secreted protein
MACKVRTDCIQESHDLLKALSVQFDVKAELELYRIHAGDIISQAPAVEAATAPVEISQPVPTGKIDAVRFEVTPEQSDKLRALPVKVAQKVRALMTQGIDKIALAELKRGQNPFEGHPALKTAGDFLISGRPLSTSELKGALQARYQWTEGTAASRASSTMGVLKAIGVLPDSHANLLQG